MARPLQQCRLIGMCRESAHGMDGRTYGDIVAKDAHPFFAIHQAPAKSALRLKARNQYAAFAPGEVVSEVVLDAPGVAHAAGGNDDGA